MKGNRTLVWKPHLGSANIDIEIGDKKINLNVPPMQAAIIYQFQIKEEWSADQLSQEIKVPASTIRRFFAYIISYSFSLFVYLICLHCRRITYWISQGIIRETNQDTFKLVEEGPMRRMSGASGSIEAVHDLDDESESVTRTSRDQRAEELQVFWTFIVNMLINLGMFMSAIHSLILSGVLIQSCAVEAKNFTNLEPLSTNT